MRMSIFLFNLNTTAFGGDESPVCLGRARRLVIERIHNAGKGIIGRVKGRRDAAQLARSRVRRDRAEALHDRLDKEILDTRVTRQSQRSRTGVELGQVKGAVRSTLERMHTWSTASTRSSAW